MSKSKPKRRPRRPRVKIVKLPQDAVLKVVAPAGIVPIVAVDHANKVVEIAPVPARKQKSWWSTFFGD